MEIFITHTEDRRRKIACHVPFWCRRSACHGRIWYYQTAFDRPRYIYATRAISGSAPERTINFPMYLQSCVSFAQVYSRYAISKIVIVELRVNCTIYSENCLLFVRIYSRYDYNIKNAVILIPSHTMTRSENTPTLGEGKYLLSHKLRKSKIY